MNLPYPWSATRKRQQSSGSVFRHWQTAAGVLLLWALLIAWASVSPAAAQQQSPVDLDVQAGYGGSYRVSQWFPVTIIAGNDGPDIRGVLEWSYPGESENLIYRHTIDLPRGARKRITMNVLSNGFARTGELRLFNGDTLVYAEQVRIEPIEAERFVVGVMSSDETILNSLAAMNLPNTSGTTVVHLDGALLPENVMSLTGIDAIFVHDIATAEWNATQRATLELWVRLGGVLVVSGGSNAESTVPGLEDLLPVEVGALQQQVSLRALGQITSEQRFIINTTTTVNRVTLQPDARTFGAELLLTEHVVGAGQVIFSAFDVGVLRAWSGEATMWGQVLDSDPNFAPAAAFRWQSTNLLRNVLQLPELNLPSFGVLLAFVVAYILIVGPINFIILRRLKRVDLAWITVPATVLVFVVGTYTVSFLLRGFEPQVLEVALVRGFEDQAQAQATTFTGIFSPRRNTYTLNMAPDTLVSTGRFDMPGMQDTQLTWTDTGTQFSNVLVDVSSLRTFIMEQTVALDGVQVRSDLRREESVIAGTLENMGSIPWDDALLVSGTAMQSLGTLAPGERETVTLDLDDARFPRLADAETEGLFNRQSVLDSVFNVDQFFVGGLTRRPAAVGNAPAAPISETSVFGQTGVYLLFWYEQPELEIQFENATLGQHAGVTLYVIRLDM